MYASIRTYRLEQGDMDEAMHLVDQDLADRLAEESGFVAYECCALGDDRILSISTFRDEDGARRSNDVAAQFVRDSLSHMSIARESADIGEVMVSRAASEMLEPAHH
jgi:hypothetical protein